MKFGKKVLSILLTMTMLLSMCATAVAEEIEMEEVIASFTTNEYDSVMKLKQTSDAELKKLGYSAEDIAAIRSFSFEKAFLERAQLPENELYGLGYNADQINLLKSYDGSSLEDNPQIKGLIAKITGNITKGSYIGQR